MELELVREYFPKGTNGILRKARLTEQVMQEVICYTIELPWHDNKQRISCIPEGRYELTKRYSLRFGWHLLVNNVKNRSYILIHAYNDALKESKGCIAPVSNWTGEGRGMNARASLKKLLALAYPEMEKENKVFITIKSVLL